MEKISDHYISLLDYYYNLDENIERCEIITALEINEGSVQKDMFRLSKILHDNPLVDRMLLKLRMSSAYEFWYFDIILYSQNGDKLIEEISDINYSNGYIEIKVIDDI